MAYIYDGATGMMASRLLWHFRDEGKAVKESLNIIANVIYASTRQPSVVRMAHMITKSCGTSFYCKVRAVYDFMKKYFRYRHDPVEIDSFKTPEFQIAEYMYKGEIKGDCDDAVILAGALLKSMGFVIRILGISSRRHPNAEIDHVALAVVMPDGRELYFDPTIDYDPELHARNVVRSDLM